MTDVPVPSAAELAALREAGMTRQKIADQYGVSLARVKRWIANLDIPTKVSREDRPRPASVDPAPVRQDFDDGMSLMEKCKVVLGRRMSEDHRGYVLDGRPCSSKQIRTAAKL